MLDRNAEHVAAMTHCTLDDAWITKTRAGLPNHAMARTTFRNFELVGPPAWGEEARAFAPRDPGDPRPRADGRSRSCPRSSG